MSWKSNMIKLFSTASIIGISGLPLVDLNLDQVNNLEYNIANSFTQVNQQNLEEHHLKSFLNNQENSAEISNLPLTKGCIPDPSLYNDCISLFAAARVTEKKQNPSTYDKEILVNKAERKLGVYLNQELLKEYRIGLAINGGGDAGNKQIQGDLKTPEGVFYSAQVFPGPHTFSAYSYVSYPSVEDAVRGLEENLISKKDYDQIIYAQKNCQKPKRKTALGSDILIHGEGSYQQPERGRNWTLGCIATMDEEIKELIWFMDDKKQTYNFNKEPVENNLRCATMIYIDSGLEKREDPITYWRQKAKEQTELLENL